MQPIPNYIQEQFNSRYDYDNEREDYDPSMMEWDMEGDDEEFNDDVEPEVDESLLD